MKKLLKKKWVVIAGVMVLILLGVGIAVPALADSGNSSNTHTTANSYFDGQTLSRIAGVLGLTPADLNSQLQSGTTLETLAQEHGVTDEAIENAMVAPYADQLTNQVKYGYLTQDQADTMLANAKNQAGSLMGQNLSITTQNNENDSTDGDNGFDCYDYMTANGYGPGTNWGYMGPGMMYGWGSYSNNNPDNSSADNSNNGSSDSSTNNNGDYQNGVYGGWGMMGNGNYGYGGSGNRYYGMGDMMGAW